MLEVRARFELAVLRICNPLHWTNSATAPLLCKCLQRLQIVANEFFAEWTNA